MRSGALAGSLEAIQTEALRALAHGRELPWPGLNANQSRDLLDKAEEYLGLYQKYHLPHGLHANVWWTDYDRSDVEVIDGCGDSVCWTGHYLAALALKHSVTHDAATLGAIHAVLDKFDLLSVVSGRTGYIARYAGPASDKGYRAYYSVYGKADPDRPGWGKRAFPGVPPYEDLVWLGNSSRDSYDGVVLGLAMAWAKVPDPDVRSKIRTLVERVGARLSEDGFRVMDGKGNHWSTSDTFKAPWMRLMMTAVPERFASLEKDYAKALKGFAVSKPRDLYDEVYFASNLLFARITAVGVLETEESRKAFVQDTVRRWYQQYLGHHLNAHFAALYVLLTGDDSESARATVQGLLVDYPRGPKWVRYVDYRQDPTVETQNKTFGRYAMLPHERVPDEFLWQWSASLLVRWDRSIPMEMPGLDVILPYWCGRSAGLIPAP